MSGIKINNKRGFTIVELLIVIVVIAILSTITIVAFNGIQARAKLVQQTAELDKIGKAIQLWSAETGKSLGESGAGAGTGGRGVGTLTAKNISGYSAVSVEDLLRNAGYLTGTIGGSAFNPHDVLLAPCTTYEDSRWVVLAIVSPAPKDPVAKQISDSGCASTLLTVYTNSTYGRNLLKAY